MKKFIFPIFFLLVFTVSCKKNEKNISGTDAAFTHYVQAFTSGVVSTRTTISIYLAQPLQEVSIPEDLFRFSPKVQGKTVRVSDRIIEFRPNEPLLPGTTYEVTFALGKLLTLDKQLQVMPFSFSTVQQSFSVTVDGLSNYDDIGTNLMQLKAYVLTADIADAAPVEALVSASCEGDELPINWIHDADGRKHFFTIDSIVRKADEPAELIVRWDGKALGIDLSGQKKLEVPALNDFKVLDATVVQQPEQCVEIRYSDPLLKGQDLEGLIELENNPEIKLELDGNLLKAWTGKRASGELSLRVHAGIKSSNYARLTTPTNFLLQFTNAEPQVRLLGKGVIVPRNESMVFPFEAISLNAVDVRVIQVYKNNVHQFFQNNRIDGHNNLKQVGRLVYQGKVDLHSAEPINYSKWNTFKIDLTKLLTVEQGAIYRVELRFRKEYSLYSCSDENPDETFSEIAMNENEAYKTEWDSPGWYGGYYYPSGYDWRERDNPCHVSYYNSGRFVSRNIMVSQLGIVAKEGKNQHLKFAVSNLLSTEPLGDVDLKLFNFQQQLIETIKTDAHGFAEVDLSKKPFLLVAQKGEQFGYLRLDDGTALSVSNFNVSGQVITGGMKGFIYGERDVWRPGDTLFLNFILETKAVQSENHPVIFSLYNPKNQQVNRRVVTSNENGFYSLTTTTTSDAPTGNWRAEVQVGNSRFSKRIKIESIKPNRLKIELDLPDDKTLEVKDTKVPMAATWLHGSPANALKAKVEVVLAKTKTEFENFKQYSFNDPATRFSKQEQIIFDGKLDESGEAIIPFNLEGLEDAPGMLNAWFTSRVFENGGDFSTAVTSAKYSPFKSYVGVRMPESEDNWYKTDTDYLPEIVTVDGKGNPVSGADLEVRLYKINWRWWWESGSENLAHYVSGSYYQPVKSWNINNAAHASKIKLNVKYNNWQDNGRYFLWVKNTSSGHAAGTTFYMSEWGGWRSEGMEQGATMLNISTDKDRYKVGEKIEVSIPSSKAGKALVSLENGTGVLDMFWVETTHKQTRFTLTANKNMAPNFYVNISLLQPYGNNENDAPLRLYGIIPIGVDDDETILRPQIKTASEIEPETEFAVEITEEHGKQMTYTLAIVDEGLLGLTNFKTPNPHYSFYQREALGVKTWDMYDYVAGAYGARLEKAFAVGGDDSMVDSEKKEANRFKPVVQTAGPFTLAAGKKQKHRFAMPNYVGAVRIMVVAGNKGAYGANELSVPVRKGLMLLATAPRKLAPNEEFELPVEVFAMKDVVKNVSISLSTNNLFELVGAGTNELYFQKPGEKMSFFKLKVKDNIGIGKIVVEAKSEGEETRYEIEIDVRNPNLPVLVQQSKLINGGETWQTSIQCPGTAGTNENWVEVSGFPPLNLAKHLDYLIQFPHGCAEQLTSAVFPQLSLADITELSAAKKLETENNVRLALEKLQAYQLASGGFSYWPGAEYVNNWVGIYVGHFLLMAERAGYKLPHGMKDRWLRFQRAEARNWKGNQYFARYQQLRNYDLTQAYRLYTLALAGNPDIGAMNRLREKVNKPVEVSWRLASAYVLAGKKEAAEQLVNGIGTEVKHYSEFSGTYGSSLRDKAMLLESLLLLDDKENAFEMLKHISEEINAESWLSTQTAAWCLMSAARFAEKYYTADSDTKFDLVAAGEKHRIQTKIPVVTIPVGNSDSREAELQFTNEGAAATFVRLMSKGIPSGIDSLSSASNLMLNVKYLDTAGKPIQPQAIKQGTDFKMELTVKHPGRRVDYKEMVLATLIPSGWEILNKRLGGMSDKNAGFDYQDIRDARIYTYFDLAANEEKTFVFYLNAAYKGQFYKAPVSCEAMYDNSVRAKLGGQIIEVK
ncbi:MG2 domain-containing protein [uncultured Draconibacterium sp.]|uniref:MG2 domain-containing protein n=1 Tax=uncultured Draconibacterium sp. TaxID=1573823 RepID=UPI003261421C